MKLVIQKTVEPWSVTRGIKPIDRTIVFGDKAAVTDAKGMKASIGVDFVTKAVEIATSLCEPRVAIIMEL